MMDFAIDSVRGDFAPPYINTSPVSGYHGQADTSRKTASHTTDDTLIHYLMAAARQMAVL